MPELKQFSFRLSEDALYGIKRAALDRKTTSVAMVKSVLNDWWATQPEGKKGPLFLEGDTLEASEPSPPKTAKKATTSKATAKKASSKKPSKK